MESQIFRDFLNLFPNGFRKSRGTIEIYRKRLCSSFGFSQATRGTYNITGGDETRQVDNELNINNGNRDSNFADSEISIQNVIMVAFIQIVSLVAFLSWFVPDIDLASWGSGMIAMKPATALMFLLSSGILICMLYYERYKKRIFQFFVTLFASWLTLFMIALLVMTSFSQYIHLDKAFDLKLLPDNDPLTLFAYMPSLVTVFLFFLISMASGIYIYNTHHCVRRIRRIAKTILVISSLAILGYIADQPLFYYHLKTGTNPMALNTAICFMVIGFLLNKISKKLKKRY